MSSGHSFQLSPSQCLWRDKAKDFVVKEVIPVASELDKRNEFPYEIMKKAHKEGFITANIPKNLGGSGLPLLDSCE